MRRGGLDHVLLASAGLEERRLRLGCVFVTGGVEANWWGGSDVNQRIFGHNINIGDDVATGNSTILQTGIAKGKPGKAQGTASLVRVTDFVFNPGGDCPEGFPLESQLVSFSWGETYDDGSLLAGNAVAVPGQVVCLDLEQTTLVGNLAGSRRGFLANGYGG